MDCLCTAHTHTRARAIAFIRRSQKSGGSHQATAAKRCVLGSTEGRPRPANRPESTLGLPALSSSSAGPRGEHSGPPRSPPWAAGFRSAGEIPERRPDHLSVDVHASYEHWRESGPCRYPLAPHTSRAKLWSFTAQARGERAAREHSKDLHTDQSTSVLTKTNPALWSKRQAPPLPAPPSPRFRPAPRCPG